MNRQPQSRQDAYQTEEFETAMEKIWNAGDTL